MITQALSEWFMSGVVWVLNGLPEMAPDVAAFFDDFLVRLDELIGIIGVWGYAIPWSMVGLAVSMSLWGVAIAIGIKLIRIIASFLTLGGGM